MGAAIGVFEGAAALRVPRVRFAPVKTTNQLLVVRSDAFELADDWTVRPGGRPDPGGVARLRLLQAARRLRGALPRRRALAGASAGGCEIDGDVSFGRDVAVKGEVALEGPLAGAGRRRCSRASAPPPGAPPAARAAAARVSLWPSMRMNRATSTSASVIDCSTIMITPATFWSSTGLRPQMRGVLS